MGAGASRPVFDLRRLIEPVSEETFFARHWDREPLVVHRASESVYAEILDLEAVDRELASDPVRLTWVDAGSGTTREARHLDDDGSVFVEPALETLEAGGTLVFDQLDRRIPSLGRFCRMLERELSYRIHANVYATAPGGRGFPLHYDTTNTFVLQIAGEKRWTLGRDRVALPRAEDRPDPDLYRAPADPMAFTLVPGDLAYIPRGFLHQAAGGAAGSLHVTLTVVAPTWAELAGLASEAAQAGGAALGALVPPDFLQIDPSLLARSLSERLPDGADPEGARRAVAAFTAKRVCAQPADLSGRLIETLRGAAFQADTVVSPRPSLVYQVCDRDDGPEVICGRTALRFDARIAAAVHHCLETTSFRPRDLPAPLTLAEKIEVVSSLVRAGLLERASED